MSAPDENEQLIVDCEKREERLTAWEHDFIVSLRERIDAGRPLTDKQANMLNDVWERVTAKG